MNLRLRVGGGSKRCEEGVDGGDDELPCATYVGFGETRCTHEAG